MTQFGDQWGSKWGCTESELASASYADICSVYLWWQHQRHPNIRNLCDIITETFEDIDRRLLVNILAKGVDGASGRLLDDWGAIVGKPRNGLGDTLYRRVIKSRARSALGRGRIDDFVDVATLISPTTTVTFTSPSPKCVRVVFEEILDPDELRTFVELLREVPALVTCLEFLEIDPDGVFEFSWDTGSGLESVEFHWGHTDGDINPAETAGFAFLVQI